jgi:hypothetical protein
VLACVTEPIMFLRTWFIRPPYSWLTAGASAYSLAFVKFAPPKFRLRLQLVAETGKTVGLPRVAHEKLPLEVVY